MDTKREEGTKTGRRTRRGYSEEQRRRIVAEASQPGVTVAAVARRHGLNDNLIFNWRRRLRGATPTLLPVRVVPETTPATTDARSGIEIRLARGHLVRLGADADPALVHAVLTTLAR